MKKALLLIFLLGELLFAQSFTMTSDNPVRSGTPGTFFEYHIKVVNVTANNLQVRIARRVNQMPTLNWSSSICVGSCFPPNVDTLYSPDDVPEIPPFDTLYFSLDLNSDSHVPGIAYVTLAVVNKLNDNDFQQITFTASTTSASVDPNNKNLKVFALMNNFPNPFNPSTVIRYQLSASSNVSLKIYNLLGQEMRTLVSSRQNAGWHTVQWDARDNYGKQAASGVYLYRLTAGNFSETKKMILKR